MRLLVMALSISLMLTTDISHGEECDGETCVAVTADDSNQLVITVKKGRPGNSSTSSPKPRPSRVRKTPWIPWLPKATASPRSVATKSRISKSRTPKPNPSPRIKRISGKSLADQVKRALPDGLIIAQPTSGALLREPVNLFTTIPPVFRTVIVVLDLPITIEMKAQYLWHFSDGKVLRSSLPGAPFPLGDIRHSFNESGPQSVRLEVIWNGRWRTGAISGAISGSIRQVINREILISPADSRYIR